ncbi:MAG TPA: PIG-L deacetylase family protein [Tepidisphaeraceae bacterium]|nr:PIG-L deacetylase family protein [Tepidisphaeraceae bacterium]
MEKQDKMNKRVLAFMAHQDDAEILCAGTLIRLAYAGWEVHIATVAAGDCGTTTLPPEQIVAIRRQEARKSAALIRGEYHCLEERDGLIVYDKPTLSKAIELFRKIAPALVFTHAPKDYMMDHEMVSALGRAASFVYAAPNITASMPPREGSRVPHLYYCDPIEGLDPLGQRVQPTSFVDITAVMPRKIQMLACHASQRQWLRAHHGMDEYIEAMQRHAADRGSEAGFDFAEAFVQHRGHAYPHNDLLTEMFG